MGKTTSTSGSSRNQQQIRSATMSKVNHSQQQASSSASSSLVATSASTLPQCKVKRNYACSKCSYYTQNPRSFLHHQKNVHAERLRVYECSHCLYASKHSQKLQRHVHMVHQNITISNVKGDQGNVGSKPLLVPPVRIRMQRSTKRADHQLAELLIEEDVNTNEAEESKIVGEETEKEVVVSEVIKDEPDDGSPSRPDRLPPTPPSPPRRLLYKKQHKQEKQSSTFIRCSVCAFGSHSQTLVNRHEKTAHLKKKFFRCMKCNYVTHMRARYTKHVKYHTMPMIKCDDCDFRTPYKWNLDRHNRNHSTTSPGTYRCMHCSFSADIKQSLTVHETNHHVPPVGGVFPAVAANRRRYRVGASDAPGSAVDGTEVCVPILIIIIIIILDLPTVMYRINFNLLVFLLNSNTRLEHFTVTKDVSRLAAFFFL